MRVILGICLCFFFWGDVSAQAKKKVVQKYVFPETIQMKVDSAVVDKMYPGVAGSPIRMRVRMHITLKEDFGVKTSAYFRVDSFWYAGYAGIAKIAMNKDLNPYAKRKRITVLCELEIPTGSAPAINGVEPPREAEILPPITHSGEFLLRYEAYSKEHYISVQRLKDGKIIYAP